MQYDNEKVASAYEKMMSGDRKAINDLPKPQPKNYFSVESNNKQSKPSDSAPISKVKKNQNFRNYLKEKVTEMKTNKNQSKKQLSKIDKNSKEFNEPRPFPKMKKKSQTKSQKNTEEFKTKMEKILENKGASLNKIQTTSNNFQQKMHKNIIKDQEQSTPPTSKHSVRIRQPGLAKKQMEQLLKINEQERKVQSQIINIHSEHKQKIDEIKQKYSLNAKDREEEEDKQIPFDSVLEQITRKSQSIREQEQNINSLHKTISKLNQDLKDVMGNIRKAEAIAKMSPITPFINEVEDIFEERQSQQDEQIQEMPTKEGKFLDPTITYQNMMGEMRKKKWGLNKRINYEGRKDENMKVISTDKQRKSEDKIQSYENGENKVVVNERFKELLLQ